MKNGYLTILMAFLGAAGISAQENAVQSNRYVEVFSSGYDGSQIALHIRPSERYSEIKGSPYLDEKWHDGRILLRDDTAGVVFPMRYNVYGNEMQFLTATDTLAISNPLALDALYIGGRRFEYLGFEHNGNENHAWFEIKNSGRIRLLVRYYTRLESGMDPVTPYHCQNAFDRFVASRYYYFQPQGMPSPVEIPSDRRQLLKMEEFSEPGIREFIRNERIRTRNEDDLTRLFNRINQNCSQL